MENKQKPSRGFNDNLFIWDFYLHFNYFIPEVMAKSEWKPEIYFIFHIFSRHILFCFFFLLWIYNIKFLEMVFRLVLWRVHRISFIKMQCTCLGRNIRCGLAVFRCCFYNKFDRESNHNHRQPVNQKALNSMSQKTKNWSFEVICWLSNSYFDIILTTTVRYWDESFSTRQKNCCFHYPKRRPIQT